MIARLKRRIGPTLLFSPSGRIDRLTYVYGWALALLFSGLCEAVLPGSIERRDEDGWWVQFLLLAYPIACLYAKRVRDIGIPGRFALLLIGVTVVAHLIEQHLGAGAVPNVVREALAWIAAITALGLLPLVPGDLLLRAGARLRKDTPAGKNHAFDEEVGPASGVRLDARR